MSDNIRFDDDFFADSEPAERKEKAPADEKGGKSKKAMAAGLSGMSADVLMKIIIAAVAVGAVIIVVLGCLVFSSFMNDNDKDGDGESTTVSSVEDDKTVGTYTVTIPENPDAVLNLRESASAESSDIAKIPNGEHLMVTEIVEAEDIIWGKVTFSGATGYVNMKYLAKSYTGTVPSAPEQTTAAPEAEQTTAGTETTTKPPVETPETTTAAPSTQNNNASSAYATGKYTVDAQPSLNLRDGHSVDAESIAKIPDKAEITIIEVYHDSDPHDSYTEYWGKTTYQGVTGWVAMGYLR